MKQILLLVVSDHDQVDMVGELLPEHPQPYPSSLTHHAFSDCRNFVANKYIVLK